MKINWKICASVGIAAILTAAYTWGIPAIVNLPKHKQFIEQKIMQESGFRINIGNPKLTMGVFPSIWVESDSISVINNDGSKALFIENPKLKIKLLPLITKKLEISHISATKEDLNFVLNKNKEFYLGDYPLKFKKKDNKLSLEKLDMNIGPYNIFLKDNLNNKIVKLNGEYLEHGEFILNKKANIRTKGAFAIDKTSTPYFIDAEINLPINHFTKDKLNLNANLENFDLSTISTYVNIFSKDYIKDLKGNLTFTSNTKINSEGNKEIHSGIYTQNLQIIGKDTPSSIIFKDKLNVNLNFETINNGVKFKNSTINAKNLDVKIDGTLTDSGKKVPAMNVRVQAKNSRLEQLCKLIPGIPDNLLPDISLYSLKKYFFYGDGNADIKFVGKGDRPDVYGNARMRNVYIVEPIPKSPQNASVDLDFAGMRMKINVFVPLEHGKQTVNVGGFIKIDGSKYSELLIESTDSVDMALAQRIVNPLHEIFKFKLGPVPIMKIKGLGSVHIRSAGTKIDPHIWGTFNFHNATASFNQIHNLEMTNAGGKINFNDTKVDFKTFGGRINNLPTEIYGNCDVGGNLNVFAKTENQQIPKMLKVINTSPEMYEVRRVIKPFTNPEGTGDLFLNIYGKAQDTEKIKFNEDIFAKGKITLHNGTTTLKDTFLPLQKINGVVNFDKKNADYDLHGYLRNSKVYVRGTAKDKYVDLNVKTEKIAIADTMDLLQPSVSMPYKKEIGSLYVNAQGGYKGHMDSDNIDYKKVTVKGKILPNMTSNNPIKISGGDFSISNGVMHGNNIKGLFNNNPFTMSFSAHNIYKSMEIADAKFNLTDFNLATLDEIKKQIILPNNLKTQVDNLIDFKGNIDINGYMKNGAIWADTDLHKTSFIYKPADAVVELLSGKANIRNDVLYLGNLNTKISSMPVFINGSIANIQKNPTLNLLVTGKPTQMFFDRFINDKSVYPVKLKGDINFTSKIKGTLDRILAKTELNIKENSSIYFMGATLSGAPSGITTSEGISTNPISIITDTIITPNKLILNSLKYNQVITSQNKKTSVQNQLVSSGEIDLLKNKILGFKNLKIKTNEPTDAKIFNILFKKPTIKQGNFVSDIVVNGTSVAPKVIGKLSINSVDIPLFDSTIRDINLDFDKDYINLDSKGVIITNDINVIAKIVNNPLPPYVVNDLNIQMDTLDMNIILNRLNDFDADNLKNKTNTNSNLISITPDKIILNNGKINADKILIKKAEATNFKTNFDIDKNHFLNVNNYSFDIANGNVEGKLKYDLANSKLNGEMNINNADAEIISANFFDMDGQIYGNVTGKMDFACTGTNSVECVSTLSGDGDFTVNDGRMPKLGSLEYLLKATNLITGGITGVSINSIIDLITPLKSGNFDNIKGNVKVENGIAKDINVYSSGKELNLYMTGSYNLASLIANMEVYGSLSKDFSSVLGLISNMSLNRLFNTIPGININEINPESTSNIYKIPNFDKTNVLRVFKAEIYGDINGTGYVKSFRWIKR